MARLLFIGKSAVKVVGLPTKALVVVEPGFAAAGVRNGARLSELARVFSERLAEPEVTAAYWVGNSPLGPSVNRA